MLYPITDVVLSEAPHLDADAQLPQHQRRDLDAAVDQRLAKISSRHQRDHEIPVLGQ
jgi:hypothetical protein